MVVILRILIFLILRILLFSLTWQYFLLGADEVDDDGAEDESVEEHDRLEASVAEEGAHHPEHEVERAHRGGVGVILPDDLHVLLQIPF